MTKTRDYEKAIFSAEIIRKGIDVFNSNKIKTKNSELWSINTGREKWDYDNEEEFFSDYRKGFVSASLNKFFSEYSLGVTVSNRSKSYIETTVKVEAPTREQIEKVFDVFEANYRRVALGGHPPKAPTDPHERISRMRFFKSWFRCIT